MRTKTRTRTAVITFRVTDLEKQALMNVAMKYNLSLGEYLRYLLKLSPTLTNELFRQSPAA